jgi:hypothetical protein
LTISLPDEERIYENDGWKAEKVYR